MPQAAGVRAAAWSPDGARIALGCEDGGLRICEAGECGVQHTAMGGIARSLAWSPDAAQVTEDSQRTPPALVATRHS